MLFKLYEMLAEMIIFFIYALLFRVGQASKCNTGWLEHADSCYWINDHKALNYFDAREICLKMNSSFLVMNSKADKSFISRYHDQNIIWMDLYPNAEIERERNTYCWINFITRLKRRDCLLTASLACKKNQIANICKNAVLRMKSDIRENIFNDDHNRPNMLRNIFELHYKGRQMTDKQVFQKIHNKRSLDDQLKRYRERKIIFITRTTLKKYITSTPKSDEDFLCSKGDFSFSGSCYHLKNTTLSSWKEANEFCKNYSNGYLFTVNNGYEYEAVMKETGKEMWLGLKIADIKDKSHNIFNWSSGEPNSFLFWWDVNLDFLMRWNCISSLPLHVDLMNSRNCSDKLPFICEYKRRDGENNNKIGEIRHKNNETCATKGWNYVNDKNLCFKIIETYGKWKDAEWICNFAGGHLINFYSNHKPISYLHHHNLRGKLYWTGIYIEKNNKLSWSGGNLGIEGDPESNTFTVDASNSNNKKYCAVYHVNKFNIFNYPCDSYLPFVCTAEPENARKIINVPEPPVYFEHCTDGSWFQFNNFCYKVKLMAEDLVPWAQALKRCTDEGAMLASITSYEENYWLLSLVYNSTVDKFWLGGRRHKNGFRWIDNLPFLYTNWNEGEPNDNEDVENCISLYGKFGGMWNDDWCSNHIGFICKRPEKDDNIQNSIGFINASTLPIVDSNDFDHLPEFSYCQEEWLRMGDKCILVVNSSLTYMESVKFCRSLHKYGDLVSIHSLQEQVTLNYLMSLKTTEAWIGLRSNAFAFSSSAQYSWVDESPLNFTYWAFNEPSSIIKNVYSTLDQRLLEGERCVESMGVPSYQGSWNNIQCNRKLQPVCSKPYYKTLSKLENCSQPYENFLKEKSSCYLLIEDQNTWEEAENVCVSLKAHLVSINDYVDQSYIWYKSELIPKQDLWIGLKTTKGSPFLKWSNGWPATFTNWGPNEPHVVKEDGCAAFHSKSGSWFVHPCYKKKSFICKHNFEKIPTIGPPFEGICPGSQWRDYGGSFCYIFQNNDKQPWLDASKWCKTEGGYLASIHSSEENYILSSFVQSAKIPAWIGLRRTLTDEIGWSDWTALNYQAWAPGEPTISTEFCIELNEHRLWNDIDCTNLKAFICKTKKVPFNMSSTKETKKFQSNSDVVNHFRKVLQDRREVD